MNSSDWQIVRSTPLFGAIPHETAQGLIGGQGARVYEKGTILFQQGMPATSFFLILDGWVKIFRITAEGTEAVVGVFRRGETFAEAAIFLGGRYPVSAEVVAKSRLLTIDGEAFRRRLLLEPRLALAMLASSSQHLKFLVEHIEQIKVLDVQQRATDFLLSLCREIRGPCVVELPYEKSLIAKRLGMTPESLSRALANLRPLGVHVRHDVVTIDDVEGLRKLVETVPVVDCQLDRAEEVE
jgi:CRP-like cAMP-binding protein